MNRRHFLGASAGALATGFHVANAADKPKRVGLIGCGWYGKCDLFRLIQVSPVEVVSLCDVDKRMLAGAVDLVAERQKSKKKPRTFADYREMLKEKDLDIVLVGTPDHWHALPMIAACEAGADVYCQKPISVDVIEGQSMVAAARKYKRVVQVGTQRRSTPHIADARDTIVKEGKLGKVGLIEVCCYYHMRNNDHPPVSKPPEFLDYEMWTGPAPLRPYDSPIQPTYGNERVPHRGWWRAFMEYGNGIMGDMCIHMFDMVRWMTGLGWPKRISSCGGILVQKEGTSNIADTQTATFDYGDLQVVWQHRTWGDPPDPKYPWAATFYGDKGTLKVSVNGYDFTPFGKGQAIHKDVAPYDPTEYPDEKTEPDLEKHVAAANRAHQRDFLKAIEARTKPVADIEEGHISSASCILANLSMKLGRSLTWDPAKHQVVGDEEANKLLRRPYRGPWVHPEPEKG
jgi:predicted dehydrogenase